MPGRELSVLIAGATGVTGRQAVRWLRTRAPALGASWGIAGRDRARLEQLVEAWPEAERPALVQLDSCDPASAAAAAARAEVLVNFAGPFARLAPALIEACVHEGSGYVDVTGEIDFVARVIDRWHAPAQDTGARIVQVCGFEALPFDLCALSAIEQVEASDGRAARVEAVLRAAPPPGRPLASDVVSRGTFESLREALAGDDAALLGDPAALVGDLASADTVRRTSPIRNFPRRGPDGTPLAPMMPSPVINPPVVQRTLALTGRAPLSYREGMSLAGLVPTRPAQAVAGGVAAALNGTLGLLARAPAPARAAATRAMGALTPAGGPREDRLEGWRWQVTATATGVAGATAEVRVDAEGHPGYLATSRMTSEAGLILADPGSGAPPGSGCLTPASALGTGLLDRFAAAGLRFAGSSPAPQ